MIRVSACFSLGSMSVNLISLKGLCGCGARDPVSGATHRLQVMVSPCLKERLEIGRAASGKENFLVCLVVGQLIVLQIIANIVRDTP